MARLDGTTTAQYIVSTVTPRKLPSIPSPPTTPVRSIESIHILVHPLFLADSSVTEDPVEAAEHFALAFAYIERARATPQNGLFFLYSHVTDGMGYRLRSPYVAQYAGFLHAIGQTLTDRLFIWPDQMLDPGKVGAVLNRALQTRGFALESDVQAFVFGEMRDTCVFDVASNLREEFELRKGIVVEAQYTEVKEVSPGMIEDFQASHLTLI